MHDFVNGSGTWLQQDDEQDYLQQVPGGEWGGELGTGLGNSWEEGTVSTIIRYDPVRPPRWREEVNRDKWQIAFFIGREGLRLDFQVILFPLAVHQNRSGKGLTRHPRKMQRHPLNEPLRPETKETPRTIIIQIQTIIQHQPSPISFERCMDLIVNKSH